MRKTKIVCTLGPATTGVEFLKELIQAGLDVARLNFSHGTHEEHRTMFDNVRQAADLVGKPIAVLGDLSGPKIRVGTMKNGGVLLKQGETLALAFGEFDGTAARICHNYEPLKDEIKPGDRILLDDGMLELEAVNVLEDDVFCVVVTGGVLKDHKGMNLPGVALSAPALTEKDTRDLEFAKELGVDYFALSFVRKPEDILLAIKLADGIPVIAKVEKPEALLALDEIVDAADGVMVARGDLGVEVGHEKVPMIQKNLIQSVKKRAKPVITATQMLNSMIDNPYPTRAEVSDVANAVLDGTDAVMLSGETSVGEYPIQAVRTMASIICEIESSEQYTSLIGDPEVEENTFSNAIADASAEVADRLGLAAIAVFTQSGRSAALVSAHRPAAGIMGFSRSPATVRRLCLFWGVMPVKTEWEKTVAGVAAKAKSQLVESGLAKKGDHIAVAFGLSDETEEFQTNMLALYNVNNSF